MFRRIICAVCAAVYLAVQTAVSITGATQNSYSEVISDTVRYISGKSVTDYFDGMEYGGSDWTAYCVARLYGGDMSEYRESAEKHLNALTKSSGFVKPTDLQRAVLAISATGKCTAEQIGAAVYNNNDFDRQGFNAYIWGLIAANVSSVEPPTDAVHTRESLAEHIISRQLDDGGFALKGTLADCDMTAAAIYALAPMMSDDDIATVVEQAVECLYGLRLESGGYSSMGVENCESAAQAVIAYISAGISPTDERVRGALSAMWEYHRESGGFAHLVGGEENVSATMQAIQAYTAVELAQRGEILFDNTEQLKDTDDPQTYEVPADEPLDDNSQPPVAPTVENNGFTGFQIKLIISVACGVIAVVVLIVFVCTRKKLWLAIAVVFGALSGGIWLINIRSADEYYEQTSEQDGLTVTLSVECHNALKNIDRIDEEINPRSVIPDDGVVIAPVEVVVSADGTAFEALINAARSERVQVDYNGSVYGAYVNGIGYIYEMGFGDMSGWIYCVNGDVPDKSAGTYVLSDGDVVEFIYTCDMGRDIE